MKKTLSAFPNEYILPQLTTLEESVKNALAIHRIFPSSKTPDALRDFLNEIAAQIDKLVDAHESKWNKYWDYLKDRHGTNLNSVQNQVLKRFFNQWRESQIDLYHAVHREGAEWYQRISRHFSTEAIAQTYTLNFCDLSNKSGERPFNRMANLFFPWGNIRYTNDQVIIGFANGTRLHTTKRIGSGAYGSVFECIVSGKEPRYSSKKAIKLQIRRINGHNWINLWEIYREAKHLQALLTDHSIKSYCATFPKPGLVAVVTIMPLFRPFLFDQKKLIMDDDLIAFNMVKVANQLQNLHAKSILHGDIQKANILRSRDGLCLVDTGFAKSIKHARQMAVFPDSLVTGLYPSFRTLSQNQAIRTTVSTSLDIWQLGQVMLDLYRPFFSRICKHLKITHVRRFSPRKNEYTEDTQNRLIKWYLNLQEMLTGIATLDAKDIETLNQQNESVQFSSDEFYVELANILTSMFYIESKQIADYLNAISPFFQKMPPQFTAHTRPSATELYSWLSRLESLGGGPDEPSSSSDLSPLGQYSDSNDQF